jgi:hypothetical protein
MSCCGKKRQEWQTDALLPRGEAMSSRVVESSSILFEYTGPTGLSVRGPFTGQPYRFAGPGARVAVDRRDASSFKAVPNLKAV